MKRSAFISDIIFTFFASFLCTLVLFRFLKVSVIMANLLAGICGLLAAASFAAAKQSKRKVFFLKKSDETLKGKLMLHLAMLSDEGKTRFFLERLTDKENGARRFGKLRICTDESFYLLRFHLAPVSTDDILIFSRMKTGKKKILLCNHLDDEAFRLCEKLNIECFDGEKVYFLLKEKNALPTQYLGEETSSEKTRQHFQLWFSRANAKRFLVGGGLILLTSLISPYPYYYLVFGCVLVLSAIFVRIFGYE